MSTTEQQATEPQVIEPQESESQESESQESKPGEIGDDGDDGSWAGEAVVFFGVGVALRGLSATDRFADGPLRHWYVTLAIVAVVTVVYHLGYRLARRLTQRRAR